MKKPAPVEVFEGLPKDDIFRVVWWYCGVSKNQTAQSEPKVEVCFRELNNDHTLGKSFYHYHCGITNLGQIPLGTIWQGTRRTGQLDFETETFHLDFDDGGWDIQDSWGKIDEKRRIIPPFSYELSDISRHSSTKILSFHLTDNPYGLVVPCLVFFSRLYGYSQYIKKVLLRNRLDKAIPELIVPDIAEAPEDSWLVTMDKHCYDEDVFFLSHLKHDPITQKRTRLIWGTSEGKQNTGGDEIVHPKVAPWHNGPAQLKVCGKWLDKDRTRFLALQILESSLPQAVELYLDRQNTNVVTGPLREVRDKKSWPNVVKKEPKERKPLTIRYSEEPGVGSNAREILDAPLGIIGPIPKVTKIVRENQGDREKSIPVTELFGDQCSGGDAHGEKDNLDEASIHTPPHKPTKPDEDDEPLDNPPAEKLESAGTLRDMWNALQQLAEKKDSPIKSLASVTSNDPGDLTGEKMQPFPCFDESTNMKRRHKRWVYLDPDHKPAEERTRRCALVVRIETNHRGTWYIMEIQRRTKDSPQKEEKEKFKVLAFRLKDEINIDTWLPSFMEALVNEAGQFDKIKEKWPPGADSFKHGRTGGDIQSTVLRALNHIEVNGIVPLPSDSNTGAPEADPVADLR